MSRIVSALFIAAALLAPFDVQAQDSTLEIGGDLFVSKDQRTVDAKRDVFSVGASTALSGQVAEDAHAVGFSVEVDADTQGDLYATGGSVSIRGPVGSDLTATGGTVRTHPSSRTEGNARLTGGSITIEGPVEGALVATGGEVFLNASIAGDALISAPRVRFGPDASVGGTLRYASTEPVDIPESVTPSGRITFEKLEMSDAFKNGMDSRGWPGKPDMEVGRGTIIGAIFLSIGSFLLVGSIFLAFTPKFVSRMRKGILARPGKTALSGLIGLSMLFGSILILALTIIGIPLVPIAILAVLIVWYLGFVLGAYAIGMGIALALGMEEDPSIPMRLLVLAVVAFFAALLNFIPFLGWMANFAIVILGTGAMTYQLFERLIPQTEAPDAAHA